MRREQRRSDSTATRPERAPPPRRPRLRGRPRGSGGPPAWPGAAGRGTQHRTQETPSSRPRSTGASLPIQSLRPPRRLGGYRSRTRSLGVDPTWTRPRATSPAGALRPTTGEGWPRGVEERLVWTQKRGSDLPPNSSRACRSSSWRKPAGGRRCRHGQVTPLCLATRPTPRLAARRCNWRCQRSGDAIGSARPPAHDPGNFHGQGAHQTGTP